MTASRPPMHRSGTARFGVALTLLLVASCSGSSDSSGPSNPPPPTGPPAAPGGVLASATGTTTIRVAWNAVNTATGYIVQRTASGLPTVRAAAATNSLDDTGLAPSTTYQYQIAAVRGTDTSAFSAAVAAATRSVGAAAATLRGDITSPRTLSSDTVYILVGFVKVRIGATLTIQAGTRIVGDTTVPASSLFITRGAKIDARGTAASPIVFTSQRAPGARAPGDWGGLVVIGNAPTSRATADALTYGRAGTALTPESYGGGSAPNDDSGTLRYVRLEFAGAAPAPGDDPMAALTLYAVGRGTTIEDVQSLESIGSGFQWYGGTVDGRFLVSYEAGDDLFAWGEGYSGRNQFVIGFQSHQPTARSSVVGLPSATPRGLQGYGCDVSNDARPGCAAYLATPLSEAVFANFTLVGPGPNVYPSSVALRASGVTFGRGSGGTLLNGVLTRWPSVGLNVREAATDTLRQRDSLFVGGVLLTDNTGGNFDPVDGASYGQQPNFPSAISGSASAASLFAALPAGASAQAGSFDWTPTASSPLRAGALASFPTRVAARSTGFFGGTLGTTAYIGAADPAGNRWWQGWTSYARN